jgi:hypothetical protein
MSAPAPNPYEPPKAPIAPPAATLARSIPSVWQEAKLKNVFFAIARGDGFHSPRGVGAIYFVVGLFLALVNVALIVAAGRYILYLTALTPVFVFSGAFLLVAGEPRERGYVVPKWTRVGLGLAFFGGIFAGIALTLLLHA